MALETSPGRERLLGDVDQPLVRRVGGADDEADRGVAGPAVEHRPAVDADQVAVAQPVTVGDAVHDHVVDGAADHSGKRGRRERRVVMQERRGRARVADHRVGDLVQLGERHPDRRLPPRRGQRPGHHPPGLAHRVEGQVTFELDHDYAVCSSPGGWWAG